MSVPAPARLAWPLVWAAIAIVLVARATSRPETRGVILDHLEFGRRLLHGEDVYGPWKSDPDAPVRPLHAPYPPSYGLLTAPFAVVADSLGDRAARFLWACLQVLALAAIGQAMMALTAGRAPPATWHWLWFVTFLLGARFVLRDTHGGGGNLINVALCLLAFVFAERGRAAVAGLLLGFSLATKPTQLWLLPVLACLSHHRAALWTVAAGLGLVLVTLLLQRLDVGPWLRWIEGSWALGTQHDPWADPALGFPPFEWMNQSLRLCVARWCGEVPPEFAARVEWGVAPPGLGLDGATVGWITRVVALLMLATLLLACRRLRRIAAARVWLLAAAFVLSVLLSPLSWKAHHVALLPVLLLLVRRAVVSRARGVWLLLATWAVCCAVFGKDMVGLFAGEATGDAADEWLNSTYVVTLWDVVLFAVALHHARRS